MFKFRHLSHKPSSFRVTLNFTIVLFVIILLGCSKKSDEVIPIIDSKSEVYLAGTDSKIWFIKSSKINGEEWLPECLKDDEWKFTRSGQFSRTNVSYSCSNGIPDNGNSGWSISLDETLLTFGGGTYEITSLNENEMVLTFPKPNGDTFVDKWNTK